MYFFVLAAHAKTKQNKKKRKGAPWNLCVVAGRLFMFAGSISKQIVT